MIFKRLFLILLMPLFIWGSQLECIAAYDEPASQAIEVQVDETSTDVESDDERVLNTGHACTITPLKRTKRIESLQNSPSTGIPYKISKPPIYS
jgi:hypothetical protein